VRRRRRPQRSEPARRSSQSNGRPPSSGPGSWHLARTETERRLSEFEFRLGAAGAGLLPLKASCLAAVCDVPLTATTSPCSTCQDGRPSQSGSPRSANCSNRVDVPNLQYATRKLVKAGLIETEGSSSRKETRYRATENRLLRHRSLCDLTRRDPAADAGGTRRLGGKNRAAGSHLGAGLKPSSASSIGGRVAARKVA